MNKHDSEIVEAQLINKGFVSVNNPKDADIIIINTCAVREHSAHRAISVMGKYLDFKKKRNVICVFLGCVAQAEQKKLLKSLGNIDIILGPQDIHLFSSLLDEVLEKGHQKFKFSEYSNFLNSRTHHHRQNNFQAFISIMSGCNNFCSYCIVPYTRGRERSRSSSDIIQESELLIKKGFKEITLLGQNVNSYGQDIENEISFHELLTRIDNLGENFWLKYITSHPKDISDELITSYKNFNNVVNHLHLPLQSGSDNILKLMNRKYTLSDYKKKIDYLRKVRNDICLTTDIIVGFPGESDIDFNLTLSAIEDIGFDFAFIFKYSDRTGTASVDFNNKVSLNVIKERHNVLLNKVTDLSLESNKKKLGQTVKVLVEKVSPKSDKFLSGRTEDNKVVIFENQQDLIGKFVNVKITDVKSWTLWGNIS